LEGCYQGGQDSQRAVAPDKKKMGRKSLSVDYYNLLVVRGLACLFDPEGSADDGASGSERPD
jgi:hypothetical protein